MYTIPIRISVIKKYKYFIFNLLTAQAFYSFTPIMEGFLPQLVMFR